MKTLQTVVGGQFGSEAKGHVVQKLTERAQREGMMPEVVRVAGPNAGHTGYDRAGTRWALRQVPVAAVTDGPATLGIAAGSEIDLPVLLDEIDRLTDADTRLMANKLLWVSEEATMITDAHKALESGSHISELDLVRKIGSTGKGIGAARSDRIMRQGSRLKDDEVALAALGARGVAIAPAGWFPKSPHIIIEGTQGYGLGLHAGFYPQCTSSDCRAIDFMAMAGINPHEYDKFYNWVVARMYPIRVAGNSGPLKDETTWADLGLPEERTTVTQKIRRVGKPDWDLVRQAVQANGPRSTKLAITMVDQMFPAVKGYKWEDLADAHNRGETKDLETYLHDVEAQVGVPIGLITTGPNEGAFI